MHTGHPLLALGPNKDQVESVDDSGHPHYDWEWTRSVSFQVTEETVTAGELSPPLARCHGKQRWTTAFAGAGPRGRERGGDGPTGPGAQSSSGGLSSSPHHEISSSFSLTLFLFL